MLITCWALTCPGLVTLKNDGTLSASDVSEFISQYGSSGSLYDNDPFEGWFTVRYFPERGEYNAEVNFVPGSYLAVDALPNNFITARVLPAQFFVRRGLYPAREFSTISEAFPS